MRAEEKELEGPDLEREQSLETEREAEQEQLPEATEVVRDVSFDHRSRLLDALQLILGGEQVNVSLLYLPQRETHALEALQVAVKGNDSMGEFVFAEDRRALLEQSLAVLQQNLTYGEPSQLAELQSKFATMTERVGELRERLVNLEDAQEEVEEFHNAHKVGKDDADPEDKPKKPDVDGIAESLYAMGDKEQPSSLTHGPEVKDAPKPKSSLADGTAPTLGQWASTLADGPEAKRAPSSSSLYDGEAPVVEPTETHDPAPQTRVVKEPPKEEKRGILDWFRGGKKS